MVLETASMVISELLMEGRRSGSSCKERCVHFTKPITRSCFLTSIDLARERQKVWQGQPGWNISRKDTAFECQFSFQDSI